jgi:hypothetical protein
MRVDLGIDVLAEVFHPQAGSGGRGHDLPDRVRILLDIVGLRRRVRHRVGTRLAAEPAWPVVRVGETQTQRIHGLDHLQERVEIDHDKAATPEQQPSGGPHPGRDNRRSTPHAVGGHTHVETILKPHRDGQRVACTNEARSA